MIRSEPIQTDVEEDRNNSSIKEEDSDYYGINIHFENAKDDLASKGKLVSQLKIAWKFHISWYYIDYNDVIFVFSSYLSIAFLNMDLSL